MEFWNTLNQYLYLVPPALYSSLDDTQKVAFLTVTGISLLLAAICVFLLIELWRGSRVSKEDPTGLGETLATEIGEDWHDKLVSCVNEGKLTRKQYKRLCRILSLVLPGAQYGHTASARLRRLFQTQQTKRSITKRLLNGLYVPSEGLKAFNAKVSNLLSYTEPRTVDEKKSRSRFYVK